ncbi:MAG: hypothetical protein KDC79_00880 [Cyclobacteriaceae bacterium]|nr:hypothetical protein [Cyclobacteriaceae bacterium]
MKAIKTLKYALIALVIYGFTACHPEEINPKQTNGDTQTETPIVND